MESSWAMAAAALMPAAGAVGVALTGKRPNLREGVSLLAALLTFGSVLVLLPRVLAGERPDWVVFEFLPGISLRFTAEPLGVAFALIASFLWFVTVIYAAGYMRGHHEKNQTRFFTFFAISIGATLAAAFAGNLLTLYLFYEILTLATYPLVTHGGTASDRAGGRTYLMILLGTSLTFLLLALGWTYVLTGSLEFVEGGLLASAAEPVSAGVLALLYALFLFGLGKAALMPFHRWLPAAMVAPTPVSALLHAVAVVKLGVFAVLKISVYVFGIDLLTGGVSQPMLYVAGITVLLASLIAMTKDNLKARLAYSTIGQLGYIVVGAALASPLGVIGGGLHIAMHAFAKITLFFAAGAILVAAHKSRVSELDGLGRAMPFTFAAFAIGSLSIIGLPPFGGMWSKYYLVLGTIDAAEYALLAILAISSLLNVVYLLAIPMRAFLRQPAPAARGEHVSGGGTGEAPLPCLIAMGITSFGCVALFFYPDVFYRLAALLTGA